AGGHALRKGAVDLLMCLSRQLFEEATQPGLAPSAEEGKLEEQALGAQRSEPHQEGAFQAGARRLAPEAASRASARVEQATRGRDQWGDDRFKGKARRRMQETMAGVRAPLASEEPHVGFGGLLRALRSGRDAPKEMLQCPRPVRVTGSVPELDRADRASR